MPQAQQYKFSDLISKLIVQLDPALYPGVGSTMEVTLVRSLSLLFLPLSLGVSSLSLSPPSPPKVFDPLSLSLFQWRKSVAPAVTNGFEIKRLGDLLLRMHFGASTELSLLVSVLCCCLSVCFFRCVWCGPPFLAHRDPRHVGLHHHAPGLLAPALYVCKTLYFCAYAKSARGSIPFTMAVALTIAQLIAAVLLLLLIVIDGHPSFLSAWQSRWQIYWALSARRCPVFWLRCGIT